MATEPGKELLWKYVFGKCESHEISFVEAWLNADPKNQKELERLKLFESISASNGGAKWSPEEHPQKIQTDKPFNGYFFAFLIIVLVFILLSIYSFIKN